MVCWCVDHQKLEREARICRLLKHPNIGMHARQPYCHYHSPDNNLITAVGKLEKCIFQLCWWLSHRWWSGFVSWLWCLVFHQDQEVTTRLAKKRGTLLLSISSPINDRLSKFFHFHTLRTICNNVIIIYSTIPQICLYTTLWNVHEICICNNNNKQTFW